MQDWDKDPSEVWECAREAGRTHGAVVEAYLFGMIGLTFSPGAMARLLDIAILTGQPELAERRADQFTWRPLRRWRWQDIVDSDLVDMPFSHVNFPDRVETALASGVEIHVLQEDNLPFHIAMVLGVRDDDECLLRISAHLAYRHMPCEGDGFDIMDYVFDREEYDFCPIEQYYRRSRMVVNVAQVQAALKARVPPKMLATQVNASCLECRSRESSWSRATCLDICIATGQRAGAELCASMDICWAHTRCLDPCVQCGSVGFQLACPAFDRYWDEWNDQERIDVAALEDRRATAAVALRTAQRASRQQAAERMGSGLFQACRSWTGGKRVPKPLVKEILALAAEMFPIESALKGREHEFLALLEPNEDTRDPNFEQLGAEPFAWETADTPEETAAGEASPSAAQDQGHSPNVKSTDDLLIAMRNSRSELPPLSNDGVVIFRLTRKANAPQVNELLFDPTGPLAALHQRVLEADCEVAPEWSPVKALFVPCTEAQMEELVEGTEGSGGPLYELSKEQIIALQTDEALLDGALRAMSKKHRAKLRRETLADSREEAKEEEEEEERMIVLEAGLRTDSSLGYPSYQP